MDADSGGWSDHQLKKLNILSLTGVRHRHLSVMQAARSGYAVMAIPRLPAVE